jgi:dephospho-CoA kinase
MEKSFKDFVPLEEGVNDPAIFKAVFLAGGPGSGKSFVVGKSALSSFGLKLVNSDNAFEQALKKAGMEKTPENIFSTKGQSLRDRATFITKKKQQGYLNGRLGLVIDGTGKDFEKIRTQKIELEKLGYETAMILVNTDLDTAVSRDKKRERTLGKEKVEPMWRSVQNNIGKFQNLFGNQFIVVDNTEGANYEGGIMSAYRKIGQWTRRPPNNHTAQRWIRDQKQRRGIKEDQEISEDLRKWFGKGPKGDWVRVGTDGDIKGKCAREPGEGKPKCMPRSKAHSMSKDDRATSARRKRRKDPVADRSGKGGKPIMVKTDVKEDKQKPSAQDRFANRLKKTHGMDLDAKLKYYEDMKKKFQQTSAKAVKSEEKIDETPQWMQPALAKTVYKTQYKHAHKLLKKIVDRKKKESGGKLRHGVEYYAAKVAPQVSDKVDPRTLAKMYEDVQISRYEWGRPEGTAYLKAVTPGEPGETTKKNKTTNKYHYKAKVEEHCGCEEEKEYDVLEMDHHVFSNEEIADMENQIDGMTFDDLVDLDIYDADELEDFESADEDDEGDIHDNIDILENLTIQGRMKRRFNARRNKQKLKVARMRASRRAADPARIKRRASRGARNMIKGRIARGRDIKTLPPAEKARIEAMAKRFGGLVARLAQRMVPVIRKNELKRLTSRRTKPQKAKKYNPARAKAQASKQKAKKFKVKKK